MNAESNGLETIVEYSARKTAFNGYPQQIVSPPYSSPCCNTEMRVFGEIHWGDDGPYTYKQCKVCTYTVRHFSPVEHASSDEL